jgi:hypothetical protein
MAVQAATADDTNLILLLGLDCWREWTVAEVTSELAKKKAEWNKLKTGVGPRAEAARRHLDALKRLEPEKILATRASLDTHVGAARDMCRERQEQDKKALLEEVQFAMAKGYLRPDEQQDLIKRYQERVPREILDQHVTSAKVATPQTIPVITLKAIDQLLDALNERSLYTFLELPENASKEQLLRAAEEKAEDARKHPVGQQKYVDQKELAGYAPVVFSDDARRAQYDAHAHEVRFMRDVLAPFEPICDLTKEISLEQVEHLLTRARNAHWSDGEAQQLLFTIAMSRGWRVAVPGSRGAPATTPQDLAVAELKKALNEARQEKAEAERRKAEAERREEQARKDRDAAQIKAERADRELRKARKEYEDRQRHIDELEAQLRLVEQERNALQATKVQDQKRLHDASARYEQLQRELEDAQARQRAAEQARIAEMAPQLTRHLVRNELVAAQAIIRSFTQVPSQWAADARRIEEGIAEAKRLLEEAKRLADSDPHHAEQLLDSVLAKCADLPRALELRWKLPPAPPSELRVVPDAPGAELSWTPSPSHDVRYVVVRKEGSQPAFLHDGDQLAVTAATRWRDDAPPPARPLWYAVYAEREQTYSTDGAIAKRAVLLLPDVTGLRCDVTEGCVMLQWRSPKEASAIIIVRREGSAPCGLEDGKRYDLGRVERFEDSDVHSGTRYFYRVYCEYLDAAYAPHYSDGVVIDAIPVAPPQVVPPLDVRGTQGLLNHTVTLIAAAPERGELRVYRSDDAPDIPPSRSVPVNALSAVLGRTSREVSGMRDILTGATRAFYTPVIVFHDTAYLGEPREYTYGPRLNGVRAETAEHCIRVRWKWGYGCEAAEVQCTPSGIAATNQRVEYVAHTPGNEADSYVEFHATARGTYDIAVRARYRLHGHVIFSDWEHVTAHLAGPLVIRYAVRAQSRVFGGKQYQILFSPSEPLPDPLPPCIVVRSVGRIPATPDDGERVPLPATQRHGDGTWVIPLDGIVFRPDTAIAVFPAIGQPYDVRFVPESPDAQRIP